MKGSTATTPHSSRVAEVFDLEGITGFAGANLLVDFLRDRLQLRRLLEKLPVQKAPWATYEVADDLECLMLASMLGIERIGQMDEVEHDPLLCLKLNLPKLPQKSTLYRTLERFDDEQRVTALGAVNRHVLSHLIPVEAEGILDIDSTVETLYGEQEQSCVGYNPRYPGRASYQPLLAFDGQSRATVHASLRAGTTPSAKEIIAFYREAKAQLPPGRTLRFLRGDKGFASEDFYVVLEGDGVGYTLKLKMTRRLYQRMNRGVLWRRLPSDSTVHIEVGSIAYRGYDWSKTRRVVLIRTRPAEEPQARLFPDYAWEYQAIVTNLDWEEEDVWHFYNQRCTCENSIKELKYGVHIDAISKAEFWPNAADLWLKVIAYNALLAFKRLGPAMYRHFSIERFRRALLRVPGILVHHARQWKLRLPQYWPHQFAWQSIRAALGVT